MYEKENILTVCERTLIGIAEHYKYHVMYHVQSKAEAIDSFRRDAYVILLIAEKTCNECEVRRYRKLYNQLKNEIIDFLPYLEMKE